MTKLRIGFYPYTYVRTNVMRSLLLKKEDYHKLMKMRVSEITKFLQDIEYQKDISALGTKYSGTELIESALSRNIERSFSKLRRICDENLQVLVDAYLNRYDFWNIKTILRALNTNVDKEEVKDILYGSGTHRIEFYEHLLESKNVGEFLKNIRGTEFSVGKEEAKSLIHLENQMDRLYYGKLRELANRIPRQGTLFKEFIEAEVETINLITLLRLKREKLPREEIESLLIIPNKRSSHLLFDKLLGLDSVEDILHAMKKTEYGELLEKETKEFSETGSLLGIERVLNNHFLKKSVLLLHQDMLSINVILGYMLAKEMEIRNLRMIIKGKSLGIEDDFIEKELVINA